MIIQRGMRVAALALAAGIAVAGCGSSSSNHPSATPSPSTAGSTTGAASGTAPAATKSTIKIGNIGSYTGPLSSAAQGAQAFLAAWAKNVNATGGIDGHPVDLIVKDDAGSAATGLTAARELIQQDKVSAIVGENSYVDAAWAGVAAAAGVPVIGGNSVHTSQESNADFFPSGTTVVAQFYAALSVALCVNLV